MPLPHLPYTDSQLFHACGAVAPAWLLLALAPKWKWSGRLAFFTSFLLSAFYVALMSSAFVFSGQNWSVHEFASWEGVRKTLAMPSSVLPCWVHFAAFDLFVGRWAALDAADRGIPRLLMLPILGLTFLFGPSGMMVYLLIRPAFRIRPRRLSSGLPIGNGKKKS